MKYLNKIICGDALSELKKLSDESIDMVITSPPYWALRDYGTAKWEGGDPNCDHKKNPNPLSGRALAKSTIGKASSTGHALEGYKSVCGKCGAKRVDKQIGLEPTFQEYIAKLCDVFDEVKRVLKKKGTCWVVLGDSYGGFQGKNAGWPDSKTKASVPQQTKPKELSKCLIQIPSRFAIEMTNRGWILRNEIIWHKPNCMPSSVKDRFTVNFEKIFFFVKSKKYYFETQYEKATYKDNRLGLGRLNYRGKRNTAVVVSEKRNTRAVWKITTKGFLEAHFAVYPEALIETPIKAGCPQFICKKCGVAREPIYKNTQKQHSIGATSGLYHKERNFKGDNTVRNMTKQIGLTDCGCKAGFELGIILDPFFGSGTTGLVAQNLGRNYIGIELNPDYIKIANERLKQKPLPL